MPETHVPIEPQLALIVARASNNVIGSEDALPWHIPEDLKRFKALTSGQAIIMGRRTWLSLPKKPLPDRLNIVMTRQNEFVAPGALVAHDWPSAYALACRHHPRVFVIGGAQIYRLSLALAGSLYVTEIAGNIQGDCYFPTFDADNYQCFTEKTVSATGALPGYRFCHYRHKACLTEPSGCAL